MEEMRKMIHEKTVPSRVPIKHYNVHLNILAHKKKYPDISALKQKRM
jgi:hypothetical protein